MIKRKQIKNFSSFIENSKIYEVLSLLENSGFEAYLAGGAVRDMLLNKKPSDFDVATNARPKDVKRIFPHYTALGEKFGTITVILNKTSPSSFEKFNLIQHQEDLPSLEQQETFEITTYRSEDVYSDSRHPDLICFSDNLYEDSKRRDFTINSLYADKNGYLIDPQNGLEDLDLNLIRTIGDPDKRFSEDALRVLRAVRFSSQLGFKIEDKTLSSVLDNWSMLSRVSSARILQEFRKTVFGVCFSKVLPLILEHDLLSQFIPLKSCVLEGNSDFLEKRLFSYLQAEKKFEFFLLDYCLAFSDDFEKSLKNFLTLFPFKKTDKQRIETVIDVLKLIRSKNKNPRSGQILSLFFETWSLNDVKKYLNEDLLKFLNIEESFRISIINHLINFKNIPEPLVRAKNLMDLGIKPGEGLRIKLKLAYEIQIENPNLNLDQIISKIRD